MSDEDYDFDDDEDDDYIDEIPFNEAVSQF